jgi:fluoride ion exporter CrcB/FEX
MNALLVVTLISGALFGAGFLLVPDQLLAPFGSTFTPAATANARLFGSALIGFAVVIGFARKSGSAEFRLGVACGLTAYYATSTVVLALAQLSGLMNALGWSIVGMHAVLFVWSGVVVLKRP